MLLNKFRRALLILKRKKCLESLSDRIFNSLGQIDSLIRSVEMVQLNVEIVEKIKQGNEVLKTLNEVYN